MDETEETTRSERVERAFGKVCYDGRVDPSTVFPAPEKATQNQLLQESLKRELPKPCVGDELPTRDEFYSDPISEWTPDEPGAEDQS